MTDDEVAEVMEPARAPACPPTGPGRLAFPNAPQGAAAGPTADGRCRVGWVRGLDKTTAGLTSCVGVISTRQPTVASSSNVCFAVATVCDPHPCEENTPTEGSPILSGPVPNQPPAAFSAPFAARLNHPT